MKSYILLPWLIMIFLTLISMFNHSNAKQTNPISDILNLMLRNPEFSDTEFVFSTNTVIAGLLCFMASSISSAGGIGGGGLFIPILTIVAGLQLKTASAFSAFMVTGGSIANVVCHFCSRNNLIDYDIALLSEPFMLLGVSIGVVCNSVFPEWLITVLFAFFLGWSTFKTCRSGVMYWGLESDQEVIRRDGFVELGEGSVIAEGLGVTSIESAKQPGVPLKKLGILFVVWCSFSLIYLLRGQSTWLITACGVEYWVLSSVQIPLAIILTAWIVWHTKQKQILQTQASEEQDVREQIKDQPLNVHVFPLMALLAGMLGGVFGIGGGMLISPLLLQLGIIPEVTAATCSFMVFFSSTMSAFQYIMLGMEHTKIALVFALICFIASIIGLLVVQRAIHEYGRASIIVFSVGIVMALSTVLITGYGALNVWKSYTAGDYMGFNSPVEIYLFVLFMSFQFCLVSYTLASIKGLCFICLGVLN